MTCFVKNLPVYSFIHVYFSRITSRFDAISENPLVRYASAATFPVRRPKPHFIGSGRFDVFLRSHSKL